MMPNTPESAPQTGRTSANVHRIRGEHPPLVIPVGDVLDDLGLPSKEPFTRQQARDAGVNDSRITRLVGSGVLRQPVKGTLVATSVPDSIELRCQCLRLVMPADAFLCDTTAAWVYRGRDALGVNEHRAVPPVCCFRRSGHTALRGKLARSGERAVVDSDLRELHGLVLTTELRTALDLGRLQRTPDMRMWGLDAMLSTGAFGLDELLGQIDRFKGQRGVVQLRALAPLADGLSASFGESALRLRWYAAGLPRPRLQIPVERGGVEAAYLDMGLEEWLFGAEYDGDLWHSDEEQIEHDNNRRHWLRTDERWWIEVFRREHTFGPLQDADLRLRRTAAEAQRTLGQRTFIL